jgi:hypothetical protein
MRHVFTLSIALVLLITAGLITDVQDIYAQESNVQPNVGRPGDTFDFFATGFEDEEYVGYWVEGPGVTYSDVGYAIDANDEGRADWEWKAPANAPTGDYLMVAQGGDSEYQVVIPFRITPHAESPGVQPEEGTDSNVEPNVGRPGDTFDFYATGFEDEERVGYWLNAPDGSIISSDGYWTDANDDGRADWEWRAPNDAMLGDYVMVARGETSFIEVAIPFQVLPHTDRPGETPEESADSNVEPYVGQPGEEFDFYAEGFDDEERVGYWLNAPDGSIISSDGYWTDANDDGRADWEWRAPNDAMLGVYVMVARGETSGVEQTIPFEVR